MSPSGVVITRFVQPLPAPLVQVATVLAAKSRSGDVVVATGGVLLVEVLPVAEAVTSTVLGLSTPPYLWFRLSGYSAASVYATRTALAPAAAAAAIFA